MEGKRIFRGLALITLPLAAGLSACGEGNSKVSSAVSQVATEARRVTTKDTAAPIPTPPTSERSREEIIHTFVDKFGGAVVLSVKGLTISTEFDVEFTRVDIPPTQWIAIDHAKKHLTSDKTDANGNRPDVVFPATSCTGIYQFAVSADQGRTFTPNILTDNRTGKSSDTFTLNPNTCTQTVTIHIQQPTSH